MQTDLNQELIVREIVRAIIEKKNNSNGIFIPVAVSNRHVHLSQADLEKLFGKGYQLHPWKELSEKGFYAAEETVVLAGPKGALNKVRVLGPVRRETQIELLLSDSHVLGIVPQIRDSGTVAPSQELTIVGPKGTVTNNTGIMAAWRHIHIDTQKARDLGLNDGDEVQVKTSGDRALILSRVRIRCGNIANTMLHIDVDEANAACLKTGDKVQLLS
jgi:putative phosphotransacetylase